VGVGGGGRKPRNEELQETAGPKNKKQEITKNSYTIIVSRPPGLAASSLAASSLAASSLAASSLATSSLAGGSVPKASLMLWGWSLRLLKGRASVPKRCICFGPEPNFWFQDPIFALSFFYGFQHEVESHCFYFKAPLSILLQFRGD
jgi:hypothetical protein